MARGFSLVFSIIILLLVLFLVFGGFFEGWTVEALSGEISPLALALLIFILLAADIFLPIPATLLAVTAGAAFGTVFGATIVAAGLTAGASLGLFLAQSLGAPFCQRLLGEKQFERLTLLLDRYGPVLLVVLRPVPILAETSVFAAGAAGAGIKRALVPITLANLGIALAYAALGAWASSSEAFLIVLAASILVPGLAWAAAQLLMRHFRNAARGGGV